MLLSQPALSRLVDRLAERGVRLALTEAGRAVQRDIGRRPARDVARSMTAGLTQGELRQLESICLKLAGQCAKGANQ